MCAFYLLFRTQYIILAYILTAIERQFGNAPLSTINMSGGDGVWNQLSENLASDMCVHVRSLQDTLSRADNVIQQAQGVNEKILVMKEVGYLTSCLFGERWYVLV